MQLLPHCTLDIFVIKDEGVGDEGRVLHTRVVAKHAPWWLFKKYGWFWQCLMDVLSAAGSPDDATAKKFSFFRQIKARFVGFRGKAQARGAASNAPPLLRHEN